MDVVGEVSGASWRRPGLGDLDGKPQVREDLVNDAGVLDSRDQAHAASAARTSEDVEVERAAHEVGPGPVAGFVGRLTLRLRGTRRGEVDSGFYRRHVRAFVGDGAAAPAGVRGEDPVVEDEIDPGAREGIRILPLLRYQPRRSVD